jgi:uncharacterized FlaG/YvyC family protein
MAINVNSFTGLFDPEPHLRQGQTSSRENHQSALKITKDIDLSEEKLSFTKTAALDQVNLPGNHNVEYEINQESNEVIIRIVNSETGEVIRKIPGEEFVKFRQLAESVNHKYVDETV